MLSSGGKLVNASASLPHNPTFTHSVAGNDVDGDGDTDLLVGVLGYYDGGAYILRNDGEGNFTRDSAALPEFIAADWHMEGQFTAAHFADINNDGKADLIVGSEDEMASRRASPTSMTVRAPFSIF